jgi:hypothetical protein
MPTDIQAFKVKLAAERQAVVDELAVIDVPAELALFEQAQAVYADGQRIFDKKRDRWSLVNDKINRLAVLDAQLAIFNP